jgi:hypothetical protein
MFKSIKEFFVGKPKVEETPVPVFKVEEPAVVVTEPAVLTPVETVTPVQPVVEEIKPETVIISVSDNMNIGLSPPDTIILTTPTDNITWPFPNTPPVEVKKKRTPATGKKPTPAITATKTKPRKKK